MVWLDKLKKMFSEEKQNPKENSKTEMSIEELKDKIKHEETKKSAQKEQLKKQLSELIFKLNLDLQGSLNVLEEFDLKRKENEKITQIVKENLNLYITYLKRLKTNLKAIDERNAEDYLKKIIQILNEFNKSSHAPFEKATFLIGKELANTKKVIIDFMNKIAQINDDHKALFEESTNIEKLNNLIKELHEKNKFISETDKLGEKNNEQLKILSKEQESLKSKISHIKNSSEHKKDLEQKNEHEKQISEFDIKLREINKNIDTKQLLKHYYNDKHKSRIVKEYNDNFKSALRNDVHLEIIPMIKEVQNIDLPNLPNLKSIQERLIELSKPFITKTERDIENLENNLKDLDSKISDINNLLIEEQKKKERLTVKKQELSQNIKNITALLFKDIIVKVD